MASTHTDPPVEPDVQVVTYQGEDLALIADEAFALEYLRRLSENRGLASEDHRVTFGAIHGIVTAGRLRRERLHDIAAPVASAKVPEDLAGARQVIRDTIRTASVAAAAFADAEEAERLDSLVAAYTGLGGDLELDDARPKGPSDIELAAADVVKAAANLGADFFAGRLEVLVEPLNNLADTVRGRRHLTPVNTEGPQA